MDSTERRLGNRVATGVGCGQTPGVCDDLSHCYKFLNNLVSSIGMDKQGQRRVVVTPSDRQLQPSQKRRAVFVWSGSQL